MTLFSLLIVRGIKQKAGDISNFIAIWDLEEAPIQEIPPAA